MVAGLVVVVGRAIGLIQDGTVSLLDLRIQEELGVSTLRCAYGRRCPCHFFVLLERVLYGG